MNIKTTAIVLITASTLFTGCVSETLASIMPSSQESKTDSVADSSLNKNKSYTKNKQNEYSTKADKAFDAKLDSWFDTLMEKLGLS